jgi:hypothetical protein
MDYRDIDLKTFIGYSTKEMLVETCEYLQVDHRKSWNKTKLSEALAQSYRKVPEKVYYTLPYEGLAFLSRLFRDGCMTIVDTSKKSYKPENPRDFLYALEILEFFGLIYIQERPGYYEDAIVVSTPYEVKKIMMPLLTKGMKETAKFLDLAADLVRGALYHYGAMPVARLIEMLKEKLPDITEEICHLVLAYRVTLRDHIRFQRINGVEYIFRNHYAPQDEEVQRKEHEELVRRISVRSDLDYKPFDLEELVLASMEGFVEDIDSYEEVADALRDHYIPTEAALERLENDEVDDNLIEEEFGMFMKAIVEEVKKTGDTSYVLKMVSRCMQFRKKEDMEKAIPLLMNFLNSIGRYELKGYSPLEVRKPFPGSGGKVVPFSREQAIGRNDPCPCGSGKKYKNCHGSGQNPLN